MGWPEMAKKIKNSPVTTMAAVAASPARSRLVRRRLAVKSYRRDRLDVPLSLSGACCRWPVGGASFGPNSHGSQIVQKWPNSVFMILESFS